MDVGMNYGGTGAASPMMTGIRGRAADRFRLRSLVAPAAAHVGEMDHPAFSSVYL